MRRVQRVILLLFFIEMLTQMPARRQRLKVLFPPMAFRNALSAAFLAVAMRKRSAALAAAKAAALAAFSFALFDAVARIFSRRVATFGDIAALGAMVAKVMRECSRVMRLLRCNATVCRKSCYNAYDAFYNAYDAFVLAMWLHLHRNMRV